MTNEESVRLRVTMANVIAGQFLEGAVMRGGGSLKLRYGESTTRFTMDFDAARNIGEDDFIERYNRRISDGWGDFAGRLVKVAKPRPRNIPAEYVMQPFEVKLTYKNHPWCTVDLEVSYDEVGDADAYDVVALPVGILKLFGDLDLPQPHPVPPDEDRSSDRAVTDLGTVPANFNGVAKARRRGVRVPAAAVGVRPFHFVE